MRTDPPPALAPTRDDDPPPASTDEALASPTLDTTLAPPPGMIVVTSETAVPYESPRVEPADKDFEKTKNLEAERAVPDKAAATAE